MVLIRLMARKSSRGEAGLVGLDAKLFLQFADQGRFGSLALLHLSAWKFPHSGIAAMRRALLEKDASFEVDECSGRNNHCRIFFHCNDIQ